MNGVQLQFTRCNMAFRVVISIHVVTIWTLITNIALGYMFIKIKSPDTQLNCIG